MEPTGRVVGVDLAEIDPLPLPSGSPEAERWIRNDAQADLPFSFRNVCEALGIEPGYLRRGLLSWRRSRGGSMPGIPVRQ